MQELSVTQLSNMIKRSVEENFKEICLKGEVSALKVHTSGHMYFNLKDENANIDCVCWKFVAAAQKLKLADGMEIRCIGKVTTYPDRSKYQFVASKFELSGEGALLKLLEERKKKLAEEGVFDLDKKQPLPKFPRLIGVITSPTGAVIQDIMHRIEGRFPTPILLYPVLVQGAQAAGQIVNAVKYMNCLTGKNRPDVLIVARGGGSLEDLMPFNDEELARVVANSQIPLVSAVGHETDTTLIDFASDLRAPTPTAAAELIVPDRQTIRNIINTNFARLENFVRKDFSYLESKMKGLKLTSPATLLENKMQKLDISFSNLEKNFTAKINSLGQKVDKISVKAPEISNAKLDNIFLRLSHIVDNKMANFNAILSKQSELLESCSMGKMFQRGLIYAELQGGQKIKSVYDIKNGTEITMTGSDGCVKFVANDVKFL